MKRLATILLFIMPLSLQADNLLKSATDALQDTGGSTASSLVDKLDFSGGLSNAVTQGLGVTGAQAEGGLGSLFGLARSTLDDQQFGSLAGAVPGLGDLLKAAPALESSAGSLAGMAGGMGGYGAAAKDAAAVYSQFQSLGLSTAAIPQYIQIVNAYLQSTGGQQAVDLFSQGVASLL